MLTAMSLLFYDKYQRLYRILSHSAFDDIDISHVFLSENEKLFRNALNRNYEPYVCFTTQLQNDPGFRKRLGADKLLNRYTEIHSYFLGENDNLQKPIFLLLFYKKKASVSSEQKYSTTVNQKYLMLLQEILPLYHRLQDALWYASSDINKLGQTNANVYASLQELAEAGDFYALHLVTKGKTENSDWHSDLNKMLKLLEEQLEVAEEKIIVETPQRLFFLLRKTDPSKIIDFVNTYCANLGIEFYAMVKKYPDDGTNLFNYMLPEKI